jgi:hypothetical protein
MSCHGSRRAIWCLRRGESPALIPESRSHAFARSPQWGARVAAVDLGLRDFAQSASINRCTTTEGDPPLKTRTLIALALLLGCTTTPAVAEPLTPEKHDRIARIVDSFRYADVDAYNPPELLKLIEGEKYRYLGPAVKARVRLEIEDLGRIVAKEVRFVRERIIRLYHKRFTAEEVEALARHYESDAGRRWIAEAPGLSAEIEQELKLLSQLVHGDILAFVLDILARPQQQEQDAR